MINKGLISSWQNWLIVIGMVYIPLAGWCYLRNKISNAQNAQ